MLTPRDVLDAIGHETRAAREPSERRHPLLDHLPPGERVTADELVARSGAEISDVHSALLELELEGEIERLRDGSFQQCSPPLPRE